MKLLLDQNLSFRLLELFEDIFPGSSHVRLVGLDRASDDLVWNYARRNGFAIVTRDADFMERSLIHGHPPKVVWVRVGNTSTRNLRDTFASYLEELGEFLADDRPERSWTEIT